MPLTTITKRSLICLIVAVALSAIAGAQQQGPAGVLAPNTAPVTSQTPEQNASVSGVVVQAAAGSPISGATVTFTRVVPENGARADNPNRGGRGALAPGGPGPRGAGPGGVGGGAGGGSSAQTDSHGAYAVSGLAPGQYRVAASASGFITQESGQQSVDTQGTPVNVTASGDLAINFQLLRSGAIEGVVLDEDNQPMPDSGVQLYAASYDTGRLALVPNKTVQANSVGVFRISGLDPGDYYIAASPTAGQAVLPPETAVPQSATVGGGPGGALGVGARGARGPAARGGAETTGAANGQPTTPQRAYPATFYPGSTSVSDAAVLHISAGSDVRSMNITLRPVILSSIRGTIVAPATVVQPPQPQQVAQPGAGPRGRGAGAPGPRAGAGEVQPGGAETPGIGSRGPGAGAGVAPAVAGPGPRGPGQAGPGARGANRGGATNFAAGATIQLIPLGVRVAANAVAGGARGGAGGVLGGDLAIDAGPANPGGAVRGAAGVAGGAEPARATARQDGTFQFENVIPGAYLLFASARANNVLLSAFGRLDLSNGNIENYPLALRQGMSVPGQIYLDGEPPQNHQTESVQITLTPADNIPVGTVTTRAGADGKFRLENVAPARYRLTVTAEGAAFVEKALFAGDDALNEIIQLDNEDTPIQLLMGFTQGRVEAAIEQAGKPFPNARVLLAPANRGRLDLFKVASSDPNGRVSFTNVAPGSYKLFAWESMTRTNAYRNPAFLEPFESNGRPVTVEKNSSVFEGRLEVLPAVR